MIWSRHVQTAAPARATAVTTSMIGFRFMATFHAC